MAKWGEGDPRWIVEHRNDGKNVNGWHWQEVNKLEWTKQRLAELLPGAEAGGGSNGWSARVTSVKSVTGEAMLTTRKGNKRFAFYDLKLALAWEAVPASSAGGQAEAEAAGGAAEEGGAEEQGGGSGRGGEEAAVSGEISVAEFGSGSDHEDIEVSISTSGGSASAAEKEAAKRVAQEALWPLVLQRLEQYVKELSES